MPTLLVVALALTSPVMADGSADDVAWFESNARPVFAAHCAECHGGPSPEADLDLESVAGIRAAIDGLGFVSPGEPDTSRLVRAVRYTDPKLRMPPTGRLSDEVVAVFEEWVRRGAPLPEGLAAEPRENAFDLEGRWREHWSWRPVGDPSTPSVAHSARVRDPLDAFVLAELEATGIEPAPAASRAVWLRRATYAATGLPPTPEELANFVADTRGDAFERAVDGLLASPRFGEHWARHWLDLVRYAETKAHEYDFPLPNAFAYRDYVVRAFEADVPYDRFLKEMIAGDLLAGSAEGVRLDPSGAFDESVLGTGWWYLFEDVHSPVDTRADECDRIANQVDTLSKSVLGLTVACARCHDHKFDAIGAEDFHALAGFALSSVYGQVRYETRLVEQRVARELNLLRARRDHERRAALADFLGDEVDALGAELAASWSLLDQVQGRTASGAAADSSATVPLAPWVNLVLEDFEGDDLASGKLAPWSAIGDAFLARPVRRADCPSWHGVRNFRGEGFLNSHAGHSAPDAAAGDRFTGRLTSAPFVIERAYLHFLVSGGDHDTTQIVLEVRSGDAWSAVRRATGERSNTYTPRRFDVADLVGQTARFVAVDDATGGWGHIGLDQIVASNDPAPAALDHTYTVPRWSAALTLAGSDLERTRELLRMTARLERAAHSTSIDAMSGFAREVVGLPPVAPPAHAQRVLVDYGDGSALLQNGSAFALRAAGDPLSHADARPGVLEFGAAVAEPGFNILIADPSSERHGGDLAYDQAGTTLVTPTFELATGLVAYFVRGRGRVFAAVDSHRMLSGPLHLEVLMEFDTQGEWQFVEHDLSRHVGAHVHIEFTAQVDGAPLDLAVARVVEFESGQSAPVDGLLQSSSNAVATPDRAQRCAALVAELRAEVAAFRAGPSQVPALDQLLAAARVEGRLAPLTERLAPLDDEERALLSELVPVSRLAPANFELEGRDEFVLRRGDAHTPTFAAPRRDLAAMRRSTEVSDAELVEPGAGSGRLELARAWTDPANPLVARVWTNRIWHYLFGAGIVSSCDDFGVMGVLPSHPELLDALARDFVASGWSTKALIRRVLLSDTFGRASSADSATRALDPTNRLLARSSVRRLEAEAIRDTLLFVGGALDESRFGPSVPVHLTTFMSGRGRPSDSGPLDGAGRRSIYQVVRRNFIAPFMAVWDFPVPSATRGVRSVSNVPAQALALMNDPFVELCAERFGARAELCPGSDEVRVAWMFQSAFCREPTPAESGAALALVRAAGADQSERRDAFADLAQTLFMLEEFTWLP